ncbi:MAG: peptidylprolyl isomerase [Terriglobia bacterium]
MGKIFVDADRVRQYYDEHKEELAQPERVRLQEILIAKPEDDERAREERMREVLTKVRLGEEFDELAREHSDAPTAEDGGELGYFEPEKLAPAIRDAIANLQEEGVADPLLTRDGWLLLKLVEHRKPGIPPFEEVEIELRNRVYMDEMRPLMREFMTDMRREAYVKVKSGYTDTGAPPDMQQPGARRATIRTKRRRPGS